MGKKYLMGFTKKGGLIQMPIQKYSMLGEIPEVKPEQVKAIGDSMGIDWESVNLEQLVAGTKVEAEEHPDVVKGSMEYALKIAYAHLREIPDYYTRLKAMEGQATQPEIPNTDANIRNADEDMGKGIISKAWTEEARQAALEARRAKMKGKEPAGGTKAGGEYGREGTKAGGEVTREEGEKARPSGIFGSRREEFDPMNVEHIVSSLAEGSIYRAARHFEGKPSLMGYKPEEKARLIEVYRRMTPEQRAEHVGNFFRSNPPKLKGEK